MWYRKYNQTTIFQHFQSFREYCLIKLYVFKFFFKTHKTQHHIKHFKINYPQDFQNSWTFYAFLYCNWICMLLILIFFFSSILNWSCDIWIHQHVHIRYRYTKSNVTISSSYWLKNYLFCIFRTKCFNMFLFSPHILSLKSFRFYMSSY